MRRTLLFFLFAIAVFQLEAQKFHGNSPWQAQPSADLNPGILTKNGLSVSKSKLFQLHQRQFTQALQKINTAARNNSNPTTLPFPSADGRLYRYQVRPSNTLHPELAKKFPTIQTYEGVGLDDPTATIRFEITPQGLSGMIWSSKQGTQVIEAVETNQTIATYRVYHKKAAKRNRGVAFGCHLHGKDRYRTIANQYNVARSNDGILRTYRLALAVTGEYTAAFGGTKAGAMAQMAITINRVNGILKREVAVALQMVPNNDQIIFTNAAFDGYTNNDTGAMLTENQNVIDNVIGNDNYDIGHVFATGNGGVAYLASVCTSSIKAGGVTGAQSPKGDPFDVDYVTHEIGHQFGANHTQNNDCSSSFITSVEPGSGSTIMGYAGICFPNVQQNSDDYFHSISIGQIKDFTTGAADNCANKTATNNGQPTADAGSDHTIPHSTPFELVGVATDPNDDVLTYAWEQMDNEEASMPPLSTSDKGPTFRSLKPSTNPIRQFPAKDTNNNHPSSTWEVLPSVSRNMDFRFTVRDNNSNGGSTAHDNMTITVAANSGPFKVLSPNGGGELSAGANQSVTWDVAGSNQAPVNCTAVNIYLSVDGGNSYPILLAENVPNDGSEEVFIQNSMVTNTARIKVKGANNVFFDVSDANFQIKESQPGFDLTLTPNTNTACQSSTVIVGIAATSIDGFSGAVNLTAELPNIFSSNAFGSSIINVGSNTTLTLNLRTLAETGSYNIEIKGTSGDTEVSKTISLNVLPSSPSAVSLRSPMDNATEVAMAPDFSWNTQNGVAAYQLELSKTADFATIFYAEANLIATNYTLPLNLENGVTYYWRVRSFNDCGAGAYSAIRTFTVTNNQCFTVQNTEDVNISSGLPSTIFSPIVLTETGMVQSVKVSIDIEHSWIGDLTISLESPNGRKATLLREICGNEDQIQLTFGADGVSDIPCSPPVSNELIVPLESFDIFTDQPINGTWKLLVSDGVELDGGQLKGWSLEVCRTVEANEPLKVLISNTTNPDCNGANTGSIQATVAGGSPDYNISWSNGANQLTLNNLGAGTYTVTITDQAGSEATATAVLEEPTAITLTEEVRNAQCNGQNSGNIKVFPSGGTPNYQYRWANGVRQFDNLNLPDGDYEVTVTDAKGCRKVASYTVTEPTPIELSFTSNDAMNGQNGSVDLQVTGGTGEYTYDWSSGANTRDVDGLAPGNFSVVVTDANGCTVSGEVSVATQNTGQDCYNITVNITLDNYGEENQWEIKDANGILINRAGPFNNFESGSVQATNLCLPPGCYDFTIFDLWGDGMCCAYGNGGYEVIENATGRILASGGSYGKQETKNFCVPSAQSNVEIVEYCGALGRNTQYEWIQTVEIAGQTFNSGDDGGYGDFTDTPVDVTAGNTLDLAFTPGFGFFEYQENWQIWIDFNGDGDFEDEGEAAFLISGKDRVTGTIGIPANAVVGKIRMRIAMKWGELIDPCESFSWGEVEDYTLNIGQSAAKGSRQPIVNPNRLTITGQPELFTVQAREPVEQLTLFPNPATDFVALEWEDNTDNQYQLSIHNQLGQLQLQRQIPAQVGFNKVRILLTHLPTGVYHLALRNGKRTISKDFVVTR
ncbi:MAG: reprolysin-like metallopeptidase [Bacteroidota bacterium]